ncbi:MAG: Cysteine-rich secretory protein family protein [Chloroflexi bacterium ADurb.Bin360]|nr:MAG: Cysteine-rich secretory protein family protein [Chloroflexi bacterium ADurb.Bin360]
MTPAPASPPPAINAPAEIANWPAEVFALINAERAAAGLGPFTWNDTLAQAATLHGLDCQQRGSCNHTGSDGSTVKMRVLRAGYPAVGAAECIVYSKTPQQAVFWWMDEVPPDDWHRRTILSTWVTEIGIAVVPNHLGSYYFIADFGRPQ